MRVLLTGSEGFVGKSVYKKLKTIEDVSSITCIEKDYMNHIGWETTLSKAVEQSDVILHIGAISDTMLKDPNEMLKYNYVFSKSFLTHFVFLNITLVYYQFKYMIPFCFYDWQNR